MYQSINDIKTGQVDHIVVLVKSITQHRAKNNSLYQKVHVRDKNGQEATFMQFDTLLNVQTPVIMDICLECVEYGSNASFKIQECREANEYPIEMFSPPARIDVKAGWAKVVQALKTMRPSLSRIVCAVISDDKNKFLMLPLNPTGAFARNSGILEASLKLLALAETAAKTDKRMDRDMLAAGALLYFIGGTDTVNEGYENTVTDMMFGRHIASYTKTQMKASELITTSEEARQEINPEDVMMLCHILAAGGGYAKPAIPEASVLSMLGRMVQETDAMCDAIDNGADQIVIDANARNRRLYKRDKLISQTEQS